MEPMDAARLLEGIRSDRPGAFESFVSLFEDRIYRFGVRMCGEREDARDVLQQDVLASQQRHQAFPDHFRLAQHHAPHVPLQFRNRISQFVGHELSQIA